VRVCQGRGYQEAWNSGGARGYPAGTSTYARGVRSGIDPRRRVANLGRTARRQGDSDRVVLDRRHRQIDTVVYNTRESGGNERRRLIEKERT